MLSICGRRGSRCKTWSIDWYVFYQDVSGQEREGTRILLGLFFCAVNAGRLDQNAMLNLCAQEPEFTLHLKLLC